MLGSLIQTVASAYQTRRHRTLLENLWRQEVWFDTPHQDNAAHLLRETMDEAGLEDVRLSPFAADGKTRYQDWITHLAWDCPAAQLRLPHGHVLADRQKTPLAVVYFSAPLGTAGAPVRGEVVDGDALTEITAADVNGKFVLTNKQAVNMKQRLLGFKPLAVVCDFLGTGYDYTENTTKWNNAWGDGPDGWFLHESNQPMTGFMLCPAAGKVLRERLKAEPRLKLEGFCQSRLYSGSSLNITATLKGTDPSKEIWIYAHNCEQGAEDNCSGVTCLVEAMMMLHNLVAAGKLPRPRHTIRFAAMEECLGMAAFATQHDDFRRRALAGIYLDGNGGPAPADERPYELNFGPLSSPTFGWPLAGLIAQEILKTAGPDYSIKPQRYIPSADDMIADPLCGIPSLWLGHPGKSTAGYHSDADTPAVCTDESLRNNALLPAVWAYAMANMDDALAAALVEPAQAWLRRNLAREGDGDAEILTRWAAGKCLRDLERLGASPAVFAAAADGFAPAQAPPLPDLPVTGPRYSRTLWGTYTMETLPLAQRGSCSRWNNRQIVASFWADGRNSLDAVARLTKAEVGNATAEALKAFFETAVAAGIAVREE